jgi:hypothetical protein
VPHDFCAFFALGRRYREKGSLARGRRLPAAAAELIGRQALRQLSPFAELVVVAVIFNRFPGLRSRVEPVGGFPRHTAVSRGTNRRLKLLW